MDGIAGKHADEGGSGKEAGEDDHEGVVDDAGDGHNGVVDEVDEVAVDKG